MTHFCYIDGESQCINVTILKSCGDGGDRESNEFHMKYGHIQRTYNQFTVIFMDIGE